jgi:hypothetical protein
MKSCYAPTHCRDRSSAVESAGKVRATRRASAHRCSRRSPCWRSIGRDQRRGGRPCLRAWPNAWPERVRFMSFSFSTSTSIRIMDSFPVVFSGHVHLLASSASADGVVRIPRQPQLQVRRPRASRVKFRMAAPLTSISISSCSDPRPRLTPLGVQKF